MQTTDQELFSILKDVPSLSYPEQYRRWNHFLQQLQSIKSPNLTIYLEMFLQRFPYVLSEWQKLIFIKPKSQVINTYTLALSKNPKSPELWKQYLEILREEEGDGENYKKELERGIQEIGADMNTAWLFQEKSRLIMDSHAKYQFYKRLFTRPLKELEKFMEEFKQWISTLSQQQLQSIYYRETKDSQNKTSARLYILTSITQIYKKTLIHRQKRSQIQSQIKFFYFNDHPDRPDQLSLWKRLILLQRTAEPMVIQNICYCYQRALMSHTDKILLWQQFFHYLQNVIGKHIRLFYILRTHKQLFLNISPNLYFYWCHLEERDNNIQQARQMYVDYQQHKQLGEIQHHSATSKLHIYLRHIQFQIRANQLMNAKAIYDNLLILHQDNTEILSHIIVEYGKFIVAKFKQMQFTKDLYKIYFGHLKYNRYLFFNYLEFMRYFENNQGYYDELMGILESGYEKAVKESEIEGRECMKYVRSHLRQALGSMNLIKISEKRFHDLEKRRKSERLGEKEDQKEKEEDGEEK